jgi:hypothetical protein
VVGDVLGGGGVFAVEHDSAPFAGGLATRAVGVTREHGCKPLTYPAVFLPAGYVVASQRAKTL